MKLMCKEFIRLQTIEENINFPHLNKYLKEKYGNNPHLDSLFIRFTNEPKLGINPHSESRNHDDPPGLYAYPLEWFMKTVIDNMWAERYYAATNRYGIVFEVYGIGTNKVLTAGKELQNPNFLPFIETVVRSFPPEIGLTVEGILNTTKTEKYDGGQYYVGKHSYKWFNEITSKLLNIAKLEREKLEKETSYETEYDKERELSNAAWEEITHDFKNVPVTMPRGFYPGNTNYGEPEQERDFTSHVNMQTLAQILLHNPEILNQYSEEYKAIITNTKPIENYSRYDSKLDRELPPKYKYNIKNLTQELPKLLLLSNSMPYDLREIIFKLKEILDSDNADYATIEQILNGDTSSGWTHVSVAEELQEFLTSIDLVSYVIKSLAKLSAANKLNKYAPALVAYIDNKNKVAKVKEKLEKPTTRRSPLGTLGTIFSKFFTALYDPGTSLIHAAEPFQILVFDISKTHILEMVDMASSKGVDPLNRGTMNLDLQQATLNTIKYLKYAISHNTTVSDSFLKSFEDSVNYNKGFITDDLHNAFKEYAEYIEANNLPKSKEYEQAYWIAVERFKYR